MTPLRAEDIQAVTFLQEQGDHFVLLHNAPGTDRHKVPLWYKYQLPRNRPSLRQCLAHLEAGGLLADRGRYFFVMLITLISDGGSVYDFQT